MTAIGNFHQVHDATRQFGNKGSAGLSPVPFENTQCSVPYIIVIVVKGC
jgi:hypothetical protein